MLLGWSREAEEAVEPALDNLTYRHLDLFALVLDDPIDVVFMRFVLTHLPANALRRMAGLLRPGGMIVVEDGRCIGELLLPTRNGVRSL